MKNKKSTLLVVAMIATSFVLGLFTGSNFFALAPNNNSSPSRKTMPETSKNSTNETTQSSSTSTSESSNVTQTQSAVIPKQSTHIVVASNAVKPAQKPTGSYETSYGSFGHEAGISHNLGTQMLPNTIYILNDAIDYQDGGQANGQTVINGDPDGTVSTWGGVADYSGTDNQNTHFIGHNPGAFYVLYNLTKGSMVSITDANNTVFHYQVDDIRVVDHEGNDVNTGEDLWNKIVGTDGGERVTLQTCDGVSKDYIVFASLIQ